MAKIPESTKTSLKQRLTSRARERWPEIDRIMVTFRGGFAYVEAIMPGDDQLSLFRLKYVGYASQWGFAIYRASHDDYQRAFLPGGWLAGTPEDALDTACGLYLGDPTTWLPDPRRNSGENH